MTIVVGRGRNWPALLALRTSLATWLLLIGGIVAGTTFARAHLRLARLGRVGFRNGRTRLGRRGHHVIGSRGKTAVAVLALVLVLSLTTFVRPFFLYGSGGFD